MPKVETPYLTLRDADGRRVSAVWSRSGKSLGISISNYQQAGLWRDQVHDLISFLNESLAEDVNQRAQRAVRFDDGEGRGLDAVWSRSGKQLIVTVWSPFIAEPGQALLAPADAEKLVRFLAESLGSVALPARDRDAPRPAS